MPVIRPISDLETSLPEITRTVHETDEPVFLDNGYGDEEMNFENEIYQKLTEAQVEAQSNPNRLSHDEVFGPLRQMITDYTGSPKNA